MNLKTIIAVLLLTAAIFLCACSNNSFALSNGVENNFAYMGGDSVFITKLSDDNITLYQLDKNWNVINEVCNDRALILGTDDNYVYFYTPDEVAIYRIKFDGTKRQKLATVYSDKGQLYENKIYFEGEDGLYRMSYDGSNQEKLGIVDSFGKFIIYNGWIYYQNHEDNGSLYKIKIDGTERKIISSEKITNSFYIYNDLIIYIDWGKDNTIWSMNIDGDNAKEISEDSTMVINIFDNKIFYNNINNNGDLYSITLEGKDKTKIADGEAYDIDIISGAILYRQMQGEKDREYRINIDGSGKVLLDDLIK